MLSRDSLLASRYFGNFLKMVSCELQQEVNCRALELSRKMTGHDLGTTNAPLTDQLWGSGVCFRHRL